MTTFKDLGIIPEIIRAIEELGFENPMPVQEQVIPHLLEKATDIIALAQTGTGKTAAFGLPIIQQIDLTNNKTQALVLCPTRELCIQIADDLTDYAKYIDGLRIIPVYGGANIETQIKALQKGVHIIAATPGRLIDLIERKVAKLGNVQKIVLDEADEMLNMGFLDSINNILSHLPKTRNTLLFSATMPGEISGIANTYMNNPIEITVGRKNSGAENIKHVCYMVHSKDKYLTLKRIADYYPDIYGIVFCRTRRETQEIADKLINDGYNAEALHGDLSQSQRDFVMQKFRIRNIQLLVATDVAARGIDVDDLTHIINYNLPDDFDAYTHRSGRTGRAGKSGISIVIINHKERQFIKLVERKIGKEFIMAKVPTGKDICEKQLFHVIAKLERVEIEHTDIEPYLPMVFRKLEWLDKEELIKRLVSVEFNRFLQYYRGAVDLNVVEPNEPVLNLKKTRDKYSKEVTGVSEKGMSRLYLNMGKMDGVYPNTLIELVRKQLGASKVSLGRIEILKRHTIIEVDNKIVRDLVSSFNDLYIEKRKIVLRLDNESPKRKR